MSNKKKLGLLIGMDSNCHTTLFGPDTNKRGEVLEDFIAASGLCTENIGHNPTYESRNSQTCIDCTLTKDMHTSVLDRHVCQDYNGSDHNKILYKQELVSIPKTWKWHRAVWDKFNRKLLKLDYNLPPLIDRTCCEEMLSNLYK